MDRPRAPRWPRGRDGPRASPRSARTSPRRGCRDRSRQRTSGPSPRSPGSGRRGPPPWRRGCRGSRGRGRRGASRSRSRAAPPPRRARRAAACPMRARSLEHYERVALGDGLAFLAGDLLDLAVVLGLDGHLHLHRLEDHERVALLHVLSDLALDLPHRAGDVSLYIGQAFLLVAVRRGKIPPVILAIDQGTTGTTCIVFDEKGHIAGRGYREFEQYFPRPGWVEHDANEIWEVTHAVAHEALDDAGIEGQDLEAIGITNQRETVVAWDRDSGEPLHRALVWQDRRTAARCDELREQGREDLFRERTGLVLDPYFSGTKMEWLIREGGVDPGAAFGTIDSWLVFKLTGRHVTDYSNASRTLLFDIRDLSWDRELCELLSVEADSLPDPLPSAHVYGETSEFGGKVSVAGIAGDQQAALYGQACHEPGLGKNTYGTGSFVLENAGGEAPGAEEGLLTTVAWGVGERVDYALEAAIFVTGAAVQWLRDQLGIIRTADETEELARSLDSNDGVYLVPAFTGLGSPHWDPYARGTLVGLTRGSGRAQLAR